MDNIFDYKSYIDGKLILLQNNNDGYNLTIGNDFVSGQNNVRITNIKDYATFAKGLDKIESWIDLVKAYNEPNKPFRDRPRQSNKPYSLRTAINIINSIKTPESLEQAKKDLDRFGIGISEQYKDTYQYYTLLYISFILALGYKNGFTYYNDWQNKDGFVRHHVGEFWATAKGMQYYNDDTYSHGLCIYVTPKQHLYLHMTINKYMGVPTSLEYARTVYKDISLREIQLFDNNFGLYCQNG